jgi:nucleoside-diphosphate-sugar epimerase
MILALEAGYRVRAVIRKAEQASKLIAHPRVQAHTTRLEFVTVPDLSISAAFDPFLIGVSGILHLASPLAIQVSEPRA